MADDNKIPMEVLELFVSNVETVSKDIDRLTVTVNELNKQVATPPRHQELEKGHEDLDEKVTLVLSSLDSIEDAIKNGIRTIKIVAGVFSISILIAVSVITYFNTVKPNENRIQIEQIMKNQTEILQKLGKEK